jgi:hypothetical protein
MAMGKAAKLTGRETTLARSVKAGRLSASRRDDTGYQDKAQRVSDAPQIRDRQNLKRVSRSRVCSAPLSCCAAPGKRWKTTTAHTPERCRRG